MERYPETRLLGYFRHFGTVSFMAANFEDGNDYATITLETTNKLAEGLELEINSEMSAENGFRAYIRFIDIHEIDEKRRIYAAEIVPHKNVKLDQRYDATNDFVHRLPRVIKNYIKKNPMRK